MITIAALYVYPVKSCRGSEVGQALLTEAGLAHDREWMIVTPEGQFLTQRELPRLALVAPRLVDGELRLEAPGLPLLPLPLDLTGEPVEVSVWRDACLARDQGEAAARWLTGFLGRDVRLVRFDPARRRYSDPGWTGDVLADNRFSDGYPLLALSRASLADLNGRLAAPLPVERFRPNLLLDGLPPYGEDELQDLWLRDEVHLRVVKPCTRCVITTTNQQTGAVEGDEPLRTLRRYRWDASLRGVTFGQNVVVIAGGGTTLCQGDELHTRAVRR